MIVVGINAFHGDAAAAVLRDGKLVAAAEEERFRRVKHWAGFPSQSVAWCLQQAKANLADVDHVAVNQNDWANLTGRLCFIATRRPGRGALFARWRNRRARADVAELMAATLPGPEFRGRLHKIEHHLAHLSSAFHVSPFQQAAVVSVDGFGDFASAAWGVGAGGDIRIDGRVHFPHSLGIFYQAVTQYLGFPDYGDEYKVMGLAPYGSPQYANAMREVVRIGGNGRYSLDLSYFRHHREPIALRWNAGAPAFADLFSPALENLLGPRRKPDEALTQRHHDIARSAQAVYEEAFLNLLGAVQKKSGLTDLALAGGCAMNSVANGKIRRATAFRRVYVPPASGDAGGAVGAAFAVWHRLGGGRAFAMDHAYWGPGSDAEEIARVLAASQSRLRDCRIRTCADPDALCGQVARAIADGQVIGWFQGHAEWGPRALGNRSIVCDPRRADMKAILNEKIKRRESFRPFAPSILEEEISDWFEDGDAVPFMSQVLPIKPGKRLLIPAVVHVDGSGRPQTVSRRANPLFYRLIEAFRAVTGVPMLLNTSFNESEPIVNTPREALDCFLRTKMDVLVLGDVIIERASSSAPRPLHAAAATA